MIVIETSAVVACLTDEPEAAEFARRIALARRRLMSSVNLLEARLVLVFSKGIPAEIVDDFLANENIEVIAFDEPLSNLAFDAYRRYGKGRHPAKLNMGDCAAYALAKSRGWPLLYKGEDFTQTDIERA
ncbi:type II toxin-antitoxin system VapC family toxin [Bosea sp. NPDC003192]|uniref:type II toxin-antitoxin system VapC family toxin n=1 Tax=Bosea sp. NPDC003192 TaxID=3390551 RepID=UPI003D01154F